MNRVPNTPSHRFPAFGSVMPSRAFHRFWHLTFIVAPLAFVSALNLWFISVADLDSEWLVHGGQIIESNALSTEGLPADGWRSADLPNFELSTRTVPPSVWYRMDVIVSDTQHAPWALYLVGPAARYAVYVNDKFVGESGYVAVPMPQHVKPLIFRFPGELLRSGVNRVHLRSVTERPRSVLQSVHIGPDAQVTIPYETSAFALFMVKLIVVIGLVAMGGVMLVLSGSRSSESIFGWYAVALLFMAAHIGIRLMSSVPFGEPQLWKNFVDIALIGYVVCTSFFVNRHVRAPGARAETWMLWWGLIGIVVLILDPLFFASRYRWFFNLVWLPAALPVAIYHTWLVIRAANATPNIENRLLAVLCSVGIAIGSCDGMIGMASLSSTVYLPYAMGPVLCVFWFFLVRRFVRAVNAAETARGELAHRVEEKTLELAASLGRVKDMEREHALSVERERIMRDMHDGVGAQLVQALSIATSRPELKSIEEPLRACLEELRLIVDSIEPVNGDLASVLGTLRMRMTRRLNEAAIQLRWQVDDIPLLSDFGPSRVLHVSRIVHEAIANALKHSRAKEITLSTRLVQMSSRPWILIEVTDDGSGAGFVNPAGRGLTNMRRRAEELGAQLTVDIGNRGTSVRLMLPIDGLGSRELPATQAPNMA